MFVHNGKRVTFVFCDPHSFDTMLNISACPWEQGSRNAGHYVMCTFLATKSIRLVRNWTSPRPICLSLHHVFPLSSCWVEFREIRYQGFTKHCLRVVSFDCISPLQYNICRTLSELQIKRLYLISSKEHSMQPSVTYGLFEAIIFMI
jgi:hypothetical protein